MKASSRGNLLRAMAIAVIFSLHAPVLAAQFDVAYSDRRGLGFRDPQFGQARRSAFQQALSAWSDAIDDETTIRVDASFRRLGGDETGATLALSGPTWMHTGFPNAPLTDVWYPAALADAIAETDLMPRRSDMLVVFNADVDGPALGSLSWHYDDQEPQNEDIDFQTVSLHEIGHGLGIISSFRPDGQVGFLGKPMIFDTLLVNEAGDRLMDLPPTRQKMTEGVFFSGQTARSAYEALGGNGYVQLYYPPTWMPGSSLSHVDEAAFQGELGLMSPYYNEPIHVIDPVTVGILADIGWQVNPAIVAVPEPASLVLLAVGALALLARRRLLRRSR